MEIEGFRSEQANAVVLQTNEQRELNFTMVVATVQQGVEVTAAPVAVETANPTLGQVITSQQVAELPLNGRDFVQLATLTPGTVQETNPNSFFNGGAVNYPRASDALWFLTQYRRWGMLSGDQDDTAIAAALGATALYREAAALTDVQVPEEIRADVFIDGRMWDGQDPTAYLDGFVLRA